MTFGHSQSFPLRLFPQQSRSKLPYIPGNKTRPAHLRWYIRDRTFYTYSYHSSSYLIFFCISDIPCGTFSHGISDPLIFCLCLGFQASPVSVSTRCPIAPDLPRISNWITPLSGQSNTNLYFFIFSISQPSILLHAKEPRAEFSNVFEWNSPFFEKRSH